MRRLAPFLLIGLTVVGCALRRAGPPPSPYCRSGSPLLGVYHPQRLKVKSRCITAVGTVEKVKFEQYDGDVHFDLRLSRSQTGLLARGNDHVGGTLIVEIIPWDRSRVRVPSVGQRVEVVGPWIDDTAHGWNEIHPAWWISAGTIEPASKDELQKVDLLLRGMRPAAADPDARTERDEPRTRRVAARAERQRR
jgi:hypothetical protein